VAAGGSIGANLEEAADARSKADFIAKNFIALKEAREVRFWLRLISARYR
jgi:four helix bundle protein